MQKFLTFITLMALSFAASASPVIKKDSILEEVRITQYASVVVFGWEDESDRHRLFTDCRVQLRKNDRASVTTNVSAIRTGSKITLKVNNRKQRCKVVAIAKEVS